MKKCRQNVRLLFDAVVVPDYQRKHWMRTKCRKYVPNVINRAPPFFW